MSRERDLKKLKKSLYQTQDILNDLITETSSEVVQKWDETRTDTGKRLEKAGKRFEKNYEQARSSLDNIIRETSKDVGKQYNSSKGEAEKAYAQTRKDAEKVISSTRKDAEKTYASTRKDAEKAYANTRNNLRNNYGDLRSQTLKRLEELRSNAYHTTNDLRHRAADLLQGVAGGLLNARNKLEPRNQLALRNAKEKHHLGKTGGFKRFIALAVVIISRKDQLLNLGQQIYHKLQDRNAQQAFKNEAREQLDTMRRLMKAYASGEYKEFPYVSIVKIVAGILYFVSVVDLVPDFIPLLGLTDDLLVLAWIYDSVKEDMQKFVDWETANEQRGEKMTGQKASPSSKTTTLADREAAVPTPTPGNRTAPGVGVQTGANSASSAGTTTGRTNTGGGTTSSGAGSTGSSAGNAASGGSTGTSGGSAAPSANRSGTSGSDKNSSGGSSESRGGGSASGGGPSGGGTSDKK